MSTRPEPTPEPRPEPAANPVAGLVHAMAAIQPAAGASAADLVHAIAEADGLVAAVAAAQARLINAFTESMSDELGGRGVLLADSQMAEELALALRVSSASAGALMGFADGLALLPRVRAALTEGLLKVAHARVLVDQLTGVDPQLSVDDRASLERELLDRALGAHVTPGSLRRLARRRIMAIDPDGAERRRHRARQRRDVSLRPDEHGMAWLTAYLPAEIAQACHAALDQHARTGDGDADDRGIGARRADALTNRLLTGDFDGAAAADRVACSVQVNVTVPWLTLAGLDDEPGHLSGYGPVDAAHARELAFGPDATWRRLLTEPFSGTVLDVGTTQYRPPKPLAEHVRLRDGECRWPGCQMPAERSDLDHTIAFPEGPTASGNLVALCRRHHRLKTITAFETRQHDRDWTLTTALGQVFAQSARLMC